MPATRARLGVIFFPVFIDLVGFGVVLPILPYYAQSFGARGLLFGALVGASSGMQFLATAVLGRLSDRVGRRPILLTTMVINAAGYVLFALAGSYVVLFVARLVSGLDRKITRLNSSHLVISYAVFCLKKKIRIELIDLWTKRVYAANSYHADC